MENAKILIVEDQPTIATGIKNSCISLGYKVTSIVDTGEKAIEKAESDKPDIILMDIRIDGKTNGIEAAENIRLRFGIPVIFSAAHLDEERIERAKITMPFGYVLKPIQKRDLKITIEMALYVSQVDQERRQTEERLRESEEKYKIAFKTNPDSVTITRLDGLYIDVNDGFTQLTGYTRQDVIGRFSQQINIWEKPEDRERFVSELKENSCVKNMETRFRCKDGSFLVTLMSANMIELHNEPHILLITKDITDRIRILKALKESQVLFSQMFEQSSTSMCLYDPGGTNIRVNPEFCKMFGVDEKVITDGRYNLFKDQAIKDAGLTPLLTEIFEKKKTMNWETSFDIGLASKSQKTPSLKKEKIFLEVFGYPILDDEGALKCVVLQHYDMTEKKKTQELLIQNEKMVSIGGLAAGMAHELNNPLGGMLQGIQNLRRRLSPELKSNYEPAKEFGVDLQNLQQYLKKREIFSIFDGIKESGKKASQIILNMLQFSRKSESKSAPHSLSTLIENVLELAGTDYNLKKKYDFRNIHIIKEFDSNLPLVPCTESEIEQVILNLLSNAAWAMANAKKDTHPQIILRVQIENEQKMARIEVEDNGPGMDEQTKKRIFEPFFTTKPVGQGTGLGLSVSYMIITNNHKGSMEVESEPGKGTKFIIRLLLDRRLTS